jgi:hypothetical protein
VLALLSELLLAIVYALHLAGMNLAAGGPVAAVWLQWRSGKDAAALPALRGLIAACLTVYTFSMVLGLAAGYLMWNLGYSPFYYDLINRLSGKIFWGIAELVVSLLCLAIPWLLLRVNDKVGTRPAVKGINIFLFLFGSLNLLYHFPLLLAVVGKIVATPNAFGGVIDAAAFRELAFTPDILSRALHFVMASLAVGGLAASYFYVRQFDDPGEAGSAEVKEQKTENADDDDEVEAAEPISTPAAQPDTPKHAMFTNRRGKPGVWLALIATTLQIPIGIWIAIAMPVSSRAALMGQNSAASMMFAIAIFAALGLLHQLVMQIIGSVTRKGLLRAGYNMLLIIILMSSVWLQIRPRPAGRMQMQPRSAKLEDDTYEPNQLSISSAPSVQKFRLE